MIYDTFLFFDIQSRIFSVYLINKNLIKSNKSLIKIYSCLFGWAHSKPGVWLLVISDPIVKKDTWQKIWLRQQGLAFSFLAVLKFMKPPLLVPFMSCQEAKCLVVLTLQAIFVYGGDFYTVINKFKASHFAYFVQKMPFSSPCLFKSVSFIFNPL